MKEKEDEREAEQVLKAVTSLPWELFFRLDGFQKIRSNLEKFYFLTYGALHNFESGYIKDDNGVSNWACFTWMCSDALKGASSFQIEPAAICTSKWKQDTGVEG